MESLVPVQLAVCILGLLMVVLYLQARHRFGKLDRRISQLLHRQETLLREATTQTAELRRKSATIQTQLDGFLDLGKRVQEQISALDEHAHDLHTGYGYIQAIQPLVQQYPVFFGGVALDGFTAQALFERIEQDRPRVILELGSGSSTVMVAALLERLGLNETRHLVVDHSRYYLDITRERFARHGFGRTAEFLHCPLVQEDGPDEPAWFGGLTEKLTGMELDLVLVDGPPGAFHPRSREPALPKLHRFLSNKAAVILDDTNRAEEGAIVKRWLEFAPEMEPSRSKHGKGFTILYKKKPL